jgi:hypothetical protein
MIDVRKQDGEARAMEYLACMRDLGGELERAMRAIADNRRSDLEESVSHQQQLCARLQTLAKGLSSGLEDSASKRAPLSGDLVCQIYAATNVLQNMNQCYAALLQHSSRCAGQMVSLSQTFQGEETTGSASNRQTWSCQR